MIVGKDSWKCLVYCFIVIAITGLCGGLCMAGYKSIFAGLANIAFGLFAAYVTYKSFKK